MCEYLLLVHRFFAFVCTACAGLLLNGSCWRG
jgi:hypothetical protein